MIVMDVATSRIIRISLWDFSGLHLARFFFLGISRVEGKKWLERLLVENLPEPNG
jgi:hypothetical protein